MRQGFTLLELATVLAIIGLIIGGVLVGTELIRSSEIKATISQVDRFRAAEQTFDDKYGGLPGDLLSQKATQFGFVTRAGTTGEGDGNGLIEGNGGSGSLLQGGGETGLYWVDLTTAGLISDGSFIAATGVLTPTAGSTQISHYMPAARIGRGNYFYVYSANGVNYYGLSAATSLSNGVMTSSPTLTVQQAYQIDAKYDDGFPTSNLVQAFYVDGSGVYWAAGGGGYGGGYVGAGSNAATPSTPYTCYDNNNVSGAQLKYSITTNPNSANCALSFVSVQTQ